MDSSTDQFERHGHTVLKLVAGQPADDARFISVFAHSLEHTGGYTGEEAKRAAGILLPDILPCDPRKPASYPANGRTLTDDAIDVFLSILTNGKLTRDDAGPPMDLLASFPYCWRAARPALRNWWPPKPMKGTSHEVPDFLSHDTD